MEKIRVLVWNENIHEKSSAEIGKIYPNTFETWVHTTRFASLICALN